MDDFTIKAASAVKQSQVENQVNLAVAGKALQAQKQQGDAVIQLIDQALQIQEQLADGYIDVQI
ncbi:MAG: putative motility protein [Pirellulaceae bacterium]|nr:putative motility protein [Pirellulaceae bacterium]